MITLFKYNQLSLVRLLALLGALILVGARISSAAIVFWDPVDAETRDATRFRLDTGKTGPSGVSGPGAESDFRVSPFQNITNFQTAGVVFGSLSEPGGSPLFTGTGVAADQTAQGSLLLRLSAGDKIDSQLNFAPNGIAYNIFQTGPFNWKQNSTGLIGLDWNYRSMVRRIMVGPN